MILCSCMVAIEQMLKRQERMALGVGGVGNNGFQE